VRQVPKMGWEKRRQSVGESAKDREVWPGRVRMPLPDHETVARGSCRKDQGPVVRRDGIWMSDFYTEMRTTPGIHGWSQELHPAGHSYLQ
jgi:hypothetical protein